MEKCTSSHNTVKLGHYEQSQIWSSFRMGKRCYSKIINESKDTFIAKVDYPKNNSHQRSFIFDENQINIFDKINSNINCTAFLHFHPSVIVSLQDNIIKTKLANIHIKNFKSVLIVDYKYAPEFNVLKKSKKAIINFKTNLDLIIDLK